MLLLLWPMNVSPRPGSYVNWRCVTSEHCSCVCNVNESHDKAEFSLKLYCRRPRAFHEFPLLCLLQRSKLGINSWIKGVVCLHFPMFSPPASDLHSDPDAVLDLRTTAEQSVVAWISPRSMKLKGHGVSQFTEVSQWLLSLYFCVVRNVIDNLCFHARSIVLGHYRAGLKVGPRLREVFLQLKAAVARTQFTKPGNHFFAHPCSSHAH